MWKITFVSILILAGCKTQEDINRDQQVDNLSVQMQDRQKLYSEYTDRIQELEGRLTLVTGKIEESEHKRAQENETKLLNFEDRIASLELGMKESKEQLKSQSEYLKKVISSLDKLLKPVSNKKKKVSKKLSPYDEAMNHYRRGRYKSAKSALLKLVENKSINGDKKARILHNLGMISYMDKADDKALVYFSRLFTQYPKSPYIKNGLLFLGKTFQRSGQTSDAKETFSQLVKQFPKTKQSNQAQKILEKL